MGIDFAKFLLLNLTGFARSRLSRSARMITAGVSCGNYCMTVHLFLTCNQCLQHGSHYVAADQE